MVKSALKGAHAMHYLDDTIVICLAKAGSNKEEEYLVSSSENGEMKLREINQKNVSKILKCQIQFTNIYIVQK
jgi:hypothetical protein